MVVFTITSLNILIRLNSKDYFHNLIINPVHPEEYTSQYHFYERVDTPEQPFLDSHLVQICNIY